MSIAYIKKFLNSKNPGDENYLSLDMQMDEVRRYFPSVFHTGIATDLIIEKNTSVSTDERGFCFYTGKNIIIEEGITLTGIVANKGLILRASESIVIRGKIDQSNKALVANRNIYGQNLVNHLKMSYPASNQYSIQYKLPFFDGVPAFYDVILPAGGKGGAGGAGGSGGAYGSMEDSVGGNGGNGGSGCAFGGSSGGGGGSGGNGGSNSNASYGRGATGGKGGGSNGGASGSNTSSTPLQNGGNGTIGSNGGGGGIIFLIAPTIIVESTGQILSKGTDGSNGNTGTTVGGLTTYGGNGGGGGGGGAGGGILAICYSKEYTRKTGATISLTGGTGGTGGAGGSAPSNSNYRSGGAGSNGTKGSNGTTLAIKFPEF